eukprot:scaffold42493_cov68-Phaeocystis_antarctica.AAC.2
MAPLPHGKQIQTPINSAFGATTGRAAKKVGGSRDYANTVELVFIIWASLNLRPPRGWKLAGDPVRTEDRTSGRADNFIWRPKHVLHT